MKSGIVLCCLLAVAVAVRDPEWEIFKSKFNRRYKSPTEEAFRKKIFLNNKLAINQQNQRYAEGQSTFTMGVNQFTDMTTLEFNQMVNSYKAPSIRPQNPVSFVAPNVAIPTSVDWTSTGCVAPVKDQGQCGACWAFSSIASVEYYSCIAKNNVLTRLSEQNLVDCTSKYGNNGCSGGRMTPSFQYIINNKGVDTEATYPYEAVSKKNRCRYNAANSGATLSSFAEILPYDSESALTNAIGSVGVVAVAMNAGLQSFQSYKSGVYDDAACTAALNHAVLAVGYGDEGGVPYFLVKNSWGTAWGDSGYVKMSRNGNNQCGIASQASYPIV